MRLLVLLGTLLWAGAAFATSTQVAIPFVSSGSSKIAMTKSFYNSGRSATPSGIDGTFPVHTFAASAPGAVPAGSIMVPMVRGTPVRYQADRCARPWQSKGGALSQTGCQFSLFLPRLAAGSAERVIWSAKRGLYHSADFTGSISGSTLTVSVVSHGSLAVGDVISGANAETGAYIINGRGPTYTLSRTFPYAVRSETMWAQADPCTVGGATQSSPVACVMQNSNLNVELTQVNQTYYLTRSYANTAYSRWGFYINPSTGAVTSGIIAGQPALRQTPCGNGTCAVTIQGPGCTGSPAANVTFPSTVTITAPGYGCRMQGSGNATASINKALANGAYNRTNRCGIVRQYLAGSVADGWEVVCAFTDNNGTTGQWGYPFPAMRAWVEDYKNDDGSVYAIRAAAGVVQDQYQPGGTWNSYTYDLQWYNGSSPTSATCLRCVGISGAPSATNNLNYLPLTRIVQMNGGGAFTFGSDAHMDWIPVNAGGATSAALNAVVPTMNLADKAYFKAAQLIEPIDDLVTLQPSSLVLTHTGDQNIVDDEGSFNSNTLGQEDCVNGWGTGGDHCWFAPVPSSGVNHYIATTAASDHGFSWLQSIRIATATQFSCQAGLYEQATRNPVNYLPSSVFTPPPAMTDPVRSGYGFPAFGGLVCFGFSSDWSTTGHPNFQWDHYSVYGRYTYLTEGEEWQLQEIDAAAQNMLGVFRDTASYGGHNYYGMSNQGYLATRLSAWTLNALQEAAKFLPPTDPAEIYEAAILFTQEYPNQADILSYTGSDINVTYASGFVPSFEPGTKLADYTSFGYPINTDQIAIGNHGGQGFNIRNQFMDYYYAIVALDGAMLFPNESSAQSIWVNSFIENYMVASAASNANCYYNIINYYNPFADSNLVPFSGWEADASNPQIVNVFPRNDDTFSTFAGRQEIEVSPFMGAGYGALHHTTATATTTVSSTGSTALSVADVSQARLGSIVVDTGSNACGGSCPGRAAHCRSAPARSRTTSTCRRSVAAAMARERSQSPAAPGAAALRQSAASTMATPSISACASITRTPTAMPGMSCRPDCRCRPGRSSSRCSTPKSTRVTVTSAPSRRRQRQTPQSGLVMCGAPTRRTLTARPGLSTQRGPRAAAPARG